MLLSCIVQIGQRTICPELLKGRVKEALDNISYFWVPFIINQGCPRLFKPTILPYQGPPPPPMLEVLGGQAFITLTSGSHNYFTPTKNNIFFQLYSESKV